MARPSTSAVLGDLHVTVEQLPPRAGMRAAVQAGRVFGPTIVEMLTDGPVTIGRYRVPLLGLLELTAGRPTAGQVLEGDTWGPATLSLAKHPELAGAWVWLARRIVEGLEAMSPDAVGQLCDDMVIGQTLIGPPGAQQRILTAEVLDAMIPDALTLFGILRIALEVNLRPFVRVFATLAGLSPAQT